MEEKKETKLDLKSIGKAASSVKALSDSLRLSGTNEADERR